MAHYDALSRDFIAKLANKPEDKSEEAKQDEIARKAIGIAKTITRGPQAVARQATGVAIRHLLEKEGGVSALKLYQILNDNYGREWWDWEPETIWQTLTDEHGITLTSDIQNLVMALQLVVNTNQAHEHWHIFEKVGHAFNLNHVDFAVMQPLDPDEAALTFKMLRRIRPKDEFESEVCIYAAASAHEAGMVYMPEEFYPKCCQEALDEITSDKELRDQVAKAFSSKSKPSDDRIAIQLEKLNAVREYIK